MCVERIVQCDHLSWVPEWEKQREVWGLETYYNEPSPKNDCALWSPNCLIPELEPAMLCGGRMTCELGGSPFSLITQGWIVHSVADPPSWLPFPPVLSLWSCHGRGLLAHLRWVSRLVGEGGRNEMAIQQLLVVCTSPVVSKCMMMSEMWSLPLRSLGTVGRNVPGRC